ncbi:MAG: DUF308 domain-containing protein [Alcaligenaceae bacterium]|nr:DUF308 domain-containing protein [Alcaligenaceae bacterium]
MTNKTKKPSKVLPYALIIISLSILVIPQFSTVASIAVELMLGWALILGAIVQIALLIMSKEKNDFFVWLISIILLLSGLYIFINPLPSAVLMTSLFAGIALVSGISSVVEGFFQQGRIKQLLIANGLFGITFALMIWFSWPFSGINFIGVLLGVHLLMSGVARLMYNK